MEHFLLKFDSLPNETSETILKYIFTTLKRSDLDKKTIAFSGDNTNFGGVNHAQGNTDWQQDLWSGLPGTRRKQLYALCLGQLQY